MINVVISGIYFPVTAALEYWVRAFKRREDCNVITVGPYPGLQIPWTKNGVMGVIMPEKYDFKPTIPLPYNGFQQNAPIIYIENQFPETKIDLWLDVNAGFFLEGQPRNGIRATFLTDPHQFRFWYDRIIHNYQFVFCPQMPYASPNEIYLPYAADSEWHTPIVPPLEKLYDVALIGNYYATRVDLMNTLRNNGKRVFFELGFGRDDAQKIYAQSLIGINWSSMADLTARVFELASMEITPLVNRVPDLAGLFDEGVDYIGFDTKEQAIEQVDYLLNNPEKAREIAINARQTILRDGHTWDDRANTILETVGLIEKENKYTVMSIEEANRLIDK